LPGCADQSKVAIAGNFRTRSVASEDDRNFLLTILHAAQPGDLGGVVAGQSAAGQDALRRPRAP
jgi:hypothetical protein